MEEESELKKQELEEIKLTVIKTSISTTLFSAYLAGKDNPNKPFFQWEKDNNIVESLIGMIDEVNSIRFNADRPTPPVETKTAEEVFKETFYREYPTCYINFSERQRETIVKIMEAYHAQFTPSTKSVEVEEAATQAEVIKAVQEITKEFKDDMNSEVIRILRDYLCSEEQANKLSDDEVIELFQDEWSIAMDMASFGANCQQQKQAETISRLRGDMEWIAKFCNDPACKRLAKEAIKENKI